MAAAPSSTREDVSGRARDLCAAGGVAGDVHDNNRLGEIFLLENVVFGRVAGVAFAKYMLGAKVLLQPKTKEPPDGNISTVGAKCLRCAEVLLQLKTFELQTETSVLWARNASVARK